MSTLVAKKEDRSLRWAPPPPSIAAAGGWRGPTVGMSVRTMSPSTAEARYLRRKLAAGPLAACESTQPANNLLGTWKANTQWSRTAPLAAPHCTGGRGSSRSGRGSSACAAGASRSVGASRSASRGEAGSCRRDTSARSCFDPTAVTDQEQIDGRAARSYGRDKRQRQRCRADSAMRDRRG